MLISNLNFLEKIEQKCPVLSMQVQGGIVRAMSMKPYTDRSMSSSRAANGQIVAISDMATTLFAQGTGGQQIDVMEFSSETGTNGEVSAGGSSSFQISATTPG